MPNQVESQFGTREKKGDRTGLGAVFSPLSGFRGHQRQVCHCRSDSDLEERLSSPEVASLTHPQLNQPRQAMFGHLSLVLSLIHI